MGGGASPPEGVAHLHDLSGPHEKRQVGRIVSRSAAGNTSCGPSVRNTCIGGSPQLAGAARRVLRVLAPAVINTRDHGVCASVNSRRLESSAWCRVGAGVSVISGGG